MIQLTYSLIISCILPTWVVPPSGLSLGPENIQLSNIISPCGGQYHYQLEFQNNSADTVFQVQLIYHFFQFGEYLPGSVSGASETELSDLNAPQFMLEAVPPGGATISFKMDATCHILNNPSDTIRDEITVSYPGGSFSFAGPLYNIKKPSLTFTQVSPLDYSGVPNSIIQQSVCVKNEGFSPVSELLFSYIADSNLVKVNHISVGNITSTPEAPAVLFYLGGNDFTSFGDGDTLFEQGEVICIDIDLTLKACGSSATIIKAGWGCHQESCEDIEINGSITISALLPSLQIGLSSYEQNGLCDTSSLIFSVANTENTGNFPGAATAIDLVLQPGFGVPESAACLYLFSFQIGDTEITATSGPSGYLLDLTSLSNDPDGPGGLIDADNDGFYDDLPAGSSFILKMKLLPDQACILNCSNFYKRLRMNANFKDPCGTARTKQFFINEVTFSLSTSSTEQFQVEYSSNDTLINIAINFNFSTSDEMVCPGAQFDFVLDLPNDVLSVPSIFSPTLNNQAIPWTLTDTILTLSSNSLPSSGVLKLQFETICQPVEIAPEAPCPIFSGDLESITIPYSITMNCTDEDCGISTLPILCNSIGPFILTCPFPPIGPGGVQIDNFTVQRLTLGWTDASLSQHVSPSTPGLALFRAMPHDTILLTAPAVFYDSLPQDLVLSVSYFGANEWLKYLTSIVEFHDIETGVSVTCNATIENAAPIINFQEIRIPISPLFDPGGCMESFTLTPGDQLTTKVIVEVTENVPNPLTKIPGLKAGYSFAWEELNLSCNSDPATLEVFRPFSSSSVSFQIPEFGCDTITVMHNLRQYINVPDNQDPFPGEYRPFALRKKVEFALPPNWIYLNGSAKVTYQDIPGNIAGVPITTQTAIIPDPSITIQNGQPMLIFQGPFPAVDLIQNTPQNEFSFQVLPSCITNQAPISDQTYYYDDYAYAIGSALHKHSLASTINNYLVGQRTLTPLFPFPIVQDGMATWKFSLKYSNSNVGLPNNFFSIQMPPGVSAVELREIIDLTTSVVYPITIYDTLANKVWAQIEKVKHHSTRNFELKVVGDICVTDTIQVNWNYHCPDYPINPDLTSEICSPPPIQTNLFLLPKNADLGIILHGMPTVPVPLCEPITCIMQGINLGNGPAERIRVSLSLPPAGINYFPDQCFFSLDQINWTAIPNPTTLPGQTNTLLWENLPLPAAGLPGYESSPNNTFYIKFSLKPTCEYIVGSQFLMGTSWLNTCGSEDFAQFAPPPIELLGAPDHLNNFVLLLETDHENNQLNCSDQNELIVSILSPSFNSAINSNESIQLTLPQGWGYTINSIQNILNASGIGEPFISTVGDQHILEWPVPANFSANQWMKFKIGISDSLGYLCERQLFSIQVVQNAAISCHEVQEGFCAVTYVETKQDFEFLYEHPVITLSSPNSLYISNTQSGEIIQFNVEAANITTSNSSSDLIIDLYFDVNSNQIFDPVEDILLSDNFISATGFAAGEHIILQAHTEIPTQYTCGGFWLVLSPSKNPCICNFSSVFIPAPPFESETDTLKTCYGTPLELDGFKLPGYSMAWSSPNIHAINEDSLFYLLPVLAEGQRFVEEIPFAVTRQGGCVSNDTIWIETVNMGARIDVIEGIACHGDSSATLIVNGNSNDLSLIYDWSNNLPDQQIQNGLPAGWYAATVSDGMCSDTSTILLVEPNALALSYSTSNYNGYPISCHGASDGTISLSVMGGVTFPFNTYSYLWSTGAQTAEITNLGAGIYAVTATDANGCRIESEIILLEPPALEIAHTISQHPCPSMANGILNLTAFGGVPPYNVFPSGTTFVAELALNNLPAGVHNIQVTDANGCIYQITDTLVEQVIFFTTHVIQPQCFGSEDGSICIEMSPPGAGMYDFTWSSGQQGACISELTAGNFSVTINSDECSLFHEIELSQPEQLQVSFSKSDNQCHGDTNGSINAVITGGVGPYSFNWSNGFDQSLQNGLAAGTYALTAADNNGCQWMGACEVTEPPNLSTSTATTQVKCNGGYDGAVLVLAAGGSPPYIYQWNTGQTTPEINQIPAGVYSVLVVDQYGCEDQSEVVISQPELPPADWEISPPTCQGESNAALIIKEPVGNQWHYQLAEEPIQSAPYFHDLAGGSYSLVIIDSINCLNQYTINIPDPPLLIPELSPELIRSGLNFIKKIELGDSLSLSVSLKFGNSGSLIKWTGPGILCDTCWVLSVKPTEESVYTAIITDENGCFTELSIIVYVSTLNSIYTPNAFSPNGDGRNDVFMVFPKPDLVQRINNFKIFDRWGEQIFESSNFLPNDPAYGWDGNFRDKPCSPGVYVWFTNITLINNQPIQLKGEVNLIR